MDINKEKLISNIDNLANIKGISRTQALIESGVGKDFVSNMVRKNTDPSVSKVMKIAEYFNVTIDYLLGNTDSPDNTFVYDEDDNLVVIDDETRELIDSLRTRPEMKILFSVSRKATKEDIIQAVKIIEALRDESEDY